MNIRHEGSIHLGENVIGNYCDSIHYIKNTSDCNKSDRFIGRHTISASRCSAYTTRQKLNGDQFATPNWLAYFLSLLLCETKYISIIYLRLVVVCGIPEDLYHLLMECDRTEPIGVRLLTQVGFVSRRPEVTRAIFRRAHGGRVHPTGMEPSS